MATTEQQAVTRDDALAFADEAFRNRDITFSHRDIVDMTGALDTFLRRHRLASVSSASAESSSGMKTWLGGDAAPDDWDGGPVLLRNGVSDHAPKYWSHASQNGASIAVFDIIAYTPARVLDLPEPVPATNQAGEVERLRAALQHIEFEAGRENGGWVHLKRSIAVHARAALATQPATSQEGEEPTCERCDRGVCVNPHYEDDDRLNKPAATPTPPTLSEDLRGSEDGTALGEVQCACSDDDGVPDVGVSIGLGNGKALWIGETLLRDGSNIGVVFHGPDQQRIVAPLPDETDWQLVADILRHHVAPALAQVKAS